MDLSGNAINSDSESLAAPLNSGSSHIMRPLPSRKRRWHTKTRTGCRTCKLRRVKCDETKPVCLKCRHLAETCEWGEVKMWLFKPTTVPAQPSKALGDPGSTSEMFRAIQFFHERTVPLLGRFNTAADLFFSRVISQLSESETAIKHQLVAIGATQEQLSNTGETRDAAALVASRHYGQALKRLADQSHAPPIQTVLVSCLLSVALESFRHDSDSLFLHLQSGLQILREWKGNHTPRHSDADEIIEHYVEPIFAQLEATAAMTGAAGFRRGKQGRDLEWTRPRMPIAFHDFAGAREKFHEVGYWLYIQHERHQSVRRGTPEFEDVNELWNEWRRRFVTFKETIPPGDEIEKLEAYLLDVYHRMHYVTFLCQSLPETEMVWDQYVDVFRECVRVCHEFNLRDDIYDPDPSRFSTSFCRDPGILPPCWQIAVNCRDPVIRHYALDLIRSHHRRCGDNDSCSVAAIAEVLMKLEEQDLTIKTSTDVPKSHRVRPLEVDLTKPGKMVLTYTRSPYLVPERVQVPLQIDSAPPVLPIKLFPLGASARLAGYQGLVRPRTYACRCKSYGIR